MALIVLKKTGQKHSSHPLVQHYSSCTDWFISTKNTHTFLLLGLYESDGNNDLSNSAVFYGLAQSTLLSEHLSRKHLPGLSSQDQMYLLALSDTVASSKDFDLEGIDTNVARKYRTKETGNIDNITWLSRGFLLLKMRLQIAFTSELAEAIIMYSNYV